jgi:CBS domain-containing protein
MLGALVSQAISRRFLPHNFYDSILIQDGHRLEHLILPRDLAGWQQWPVSALASPAPVVARAWDAKALENLLHQHPYSRFPVVMDGKVTGILLREEARQALAQHRTPALQPATCCGPEDPVRTVQTLLLESPTGMVVVWDPARQEVTGVVTLHDLLRAEMALADHQA